MLYVRPSYIDSLGVSVAASTMLVKPPLHPVRVMGFVSLARLIATSD